MIKAPTEPLVWPAVTRLQPGIRAFAGHTNTMLDVVGRIGAPPSLAIFSEGNHLMALISDDIVGAFPQYAPSSCSTIRASIRVLLLGPDHMLVAFLPAGSPADWRS